MDSRANSSVASRVAPADVTRILSAFVAAIGLGTLPRSAHTNLSATNHSRHCAVSPKYRSSPR